MKFSFSSRKPLDEYQEAKALGIETKPVLIGPLTFLLLGKCADGEFDRLELLDSLVEVYAEVLEELGKAGRGVGPDRRAGAGRGPHARPSWRRWSAPTRGSVRSRARPKILLNTYFDHVGEAFPVLARLPVEGIGLDFVRGERNLDLIRRSRLAGGQDAVRRRRIRPQRLDQRPRAQPRAAAGAAGSGRRRPRRLDLLLAAPLPDRQAQRAEPRRRGAELDVVRRPEAGRGGGSDEGAERGRATRSPPTLDANRKALETGARPSARATPPCASGWRTVTDADARSAEPVRRAARGPAPAARPAAVPDDDDRLVPADARRSARRSAGFARARSTRSSTST